MSTKEVVASAASIAAAKKNTSTGGAKIEKAPVTSQPLPAPVEADYYYEDEKFPGEIASEDVLKALRRFVSHYICEHNSICALYVLRCAHCLRNVVQPLICNLAQFSLLFISIC